MKFYKTKPIPFPDTLRRQSGTIKEMNAAAHLIVGLGLLGTQTAMGVSVPGARAIFENRCLICHGQAQTAGLDLRQIDSITKGGKGGPALGPGNAEQSLLYKAVARTGDLQMPPGKPLSAEEIAIIRAWIDEGAPWDSAAAGDPGWWSFRKVVRPAVPANNQK